MKRFTIFCLFLMITLSSNAQWTQVWSDEFNGSIGPDWVFETGAGGWGNNEYQYYQSSNAWISNNQLVITAKRENVGGASYTSARLKTQGRKSFKYGKMEARMAIPSVQGIWPAFWMLGTNIGSAAWPHCGEIDIMEHVNTESYIHGNAHWQGPAGYANYGGKISTSPTAYHTYWVEWDASLIKWFIDGIKYHEMSIANSVNSTHEFHQPYFFLLNMAVGGNWPGFTIDNSRFPVNFHIDYVRAFQAGSTPPPSSSQTVQAESFSAMSGVQVEGTSDAGGGSNVGWIDNGDWMAYGNINVPSSGSYRVEYRVASPNSTGRLSLDLNSGSIQLGALNIPNTGGWQNWTTISHTLNLNAGTYSFGVFAQAGGWNFNWWRITRLAETNDSPEEGQIQTASANDLKLFPNPVINDLYIDAPAEFIGGDMRIIDRLGAESVKSTFTGNKVNVAQLRSGMYIVNISKGGKKVFKKFMKQ